MSYNLRLLGLLSIFIVIGASSVAFGGSTARACVAPGSFSCTNFSVSTSGTLSFTLIQGTGVTIYNPKISCLSLSNSSYSSPSNTVIYTSLQQSSLQSGQAIFAHGITCYEQSGPIGGPGWGTGAVFGGNIWINYTANPGAPSPQNPWITAWVASITAPIGTPGTLTAPALTTSNYVQLGYPLSFAFSWSGGVAPYNLSLIQTGSSTNCSASVIKTYNVSLSASYAVIATYTLQPLTQAGNYKYCAKVSDSVGDITYSQIVPVNASSSPTVPTTTSTSTSSSSISSTSTTTILGSQNASFSVGLFILPTPATNGHSNHRLNWTTTAGNYTSLEAYWIGGRNASNYNLSIVSGPSASCNSDTYTYLSLGAGGYTPYSSSIEFFATFPHSTYMCVKAVSPNGIIYSTPVVITVPGTAPSILVPTVGLNLAVRQTGTTEFLNGAWEDAIAPYNVTFYSSTSSTCPQGTRTVLWSSIMTDPYWYQSNVKQVYNVSASPYYCLSVVASNGNKTLVVPSPVALQSTSTSTISGYTSTSGTTAPSSSTVVPTTAASTSVSTTIATSGSSIPATTSATTTMPQVQQSSFLGIISEIINWFRSISKF